MLKLETKRVFTLAELIQAFDAWVIPPDRSEVYVRSDLHEKGGLLIQLNESILTDGSKVSEIIFQ